MPGQINPALSAVEVADAVLMHNCRLVNDRDAVVVRLKADHMLAAGGRFAVPVEGELRELWLMDTGETGEMSYEIKTNAASLRGQVLGANVRCCGQDPQQDTGLIEVTFEQGGMQLNCEPPVTFQPTAVAACESGTARRLPSIRVAFLGLALALLTLAGTSWSQVPSKDMGIAKFVLDYDVPESPAAAAIGGTAATILRAGTAKPIAIDVLSKINAKERVDKGIALELAPATLLGWGFASVRAYREDRGFRRALSRGTISIATRETGTDGKDLLGAIGVRLTLHDDHDPLMSSLNLARRVGRALALSADDPAVVISASDDVASGVDTVYANVRKSIGETRGWAFSLAWATAETFRSGIISADSGSAPAHSAWGLATFYVGAGTSSSVAAQWQRLEAWDTAWRFGVSVRSERKRYSLAGETYYLSKTADGQDGRLGLGLDADVRIVRGIHALIAGQSSDEIGRSSAFRLKASLKWNLSELGG